MREKELIKDEFLKKFGIVPEVCASAPGRINLIGEHTDYNDGFVFPMAIERRIWIAGRRRDDDQINLISLNNMPEITLDMKALRKNNHWSDYPAGVFSELIKSGQNLSGIDAIVYGDVPLGSGLSSSAALLVSSLYLYIGLFDLEIESIERALLTLRAETEFVGLECGIMDQYIAVLGKSDHALFIDCRSLDSENVPLNLGNHVIAIIDTKKPRDLVESKYNERCHECNTGVRILQEAGEEGVKALRDVTIEMLEKHEDKMPENVFRRCRHVVTEDNRVLQSIDYLKQGNLRKFGNLMNDSHDSLRSDYEVSCEELDVIVETARSINGVLGVRLTGAGFGGCAIALVDKFVLRELKDRIIEKYKQDFGYAPNMFVTKATDGAEF
ncbi:MAG: galactokinase [bacterium]|nr:MAG: galactokinase [bacterium]